MSTPGDPFLTSTLDDRRRRQRRILRTLPAGVVERITVDGTDVAIPSGADLPWLETELRRLADQEMIHLEEIVRRTEEENGRRLVLAFLKANGGADDDALQPLTDELAVEASRGSMESLAQRRLSALRRFVSLAAWADEVAERIGSSIDAGA